mmetsp:Transcript_22662/g.55011  ORF Transcript_22662/g.55011 Transcript_22662/m.55011 type:complete len:184 (+) Transcript_22662:3-554(+)
MCRPERLANAKVFRPTAEAPAYSAEELKEMTEDLFWSAALSIIASYAQMFQCLRALDKQFEFGLNLPATIATFRAGCILQGYLLSPMTKAFEKDPNLPSLMNAFDKELTQNFGRFKRCMANVLSKTNAAVPVMAASMNYILTMHSENVPSAQCVALQRDVFGRHGFKRLDKDGDFNAQWKELQ